jgi:alkylhydroperoxidase family enzyme
VRALVRGDSEAAVSSAKERALLAFVKTLTLTPAAVTDEQIAGLRKAGWRDEQIFEAAFDTALFAFFNRIAETYGLASPTDLRVALRPERTSPQ